jgi:hypothetical protein
MQFLEKMPSVLELKFAKEARFLDRHARESGHPEVFEIPGFPVVLAIASLPGITLKLFNGFRKHHTSILELKFVE